MLSENKHLRAELEQRDKIINELKAQNSKLKEAETKRNTEFENIKKEHSQLLEQIETLRNSSSPVPIKNEAEGDRSDASEKVSLLKK